MDSLEEASLIARHELCARQQVQLIGSVQPHGLLFALSEPDLVVRHVSANISAVLGISPEKVLGGSFEAVLPAPHFESFQYQALSGEHLGATLLSLPSGNHTLEMHSIAHRQDGVLIVEMEPVAGAHSLHPLDIETHVRIPLSRLEAASDICELAQLTAGEIRRLSGFDRVMVYRFDGEYNGEVIAEVVEDAPISYLGLRFPATDIPPQVRPLFLINPLRMIVDAGAAPVTIIPAIGPPTGRPLDLTRSLLRSAAPVHLEYLGNMGVQSSLTISIIVEGRLWGLIACHHPVPRRVDHLTRSVCGLIGEMLASQVKLRLDNLALQARLASRKLLEKCMAEMESTESLFVSGRIPLAALLDLLDADGIIARVDGVVSSQGFAVEEGTLLPVISTLRNLSSRGIACSSKLSDLDSTSASYANQVSGALYMGLTEGCGDYLLLLRRELVETVVWAGNPYTAVTADQQGQLHPRSSFAAWQEIMRGSSRPWSELELDRARALREQLLRLHAAKKLHESEKHVRYLAHHDTLTGLFNRHSIRLKLDQFVKEAEADQSSLAVLFIDLDHFKHLNDTLGHATGDTILKMEHHVREGDVVGRLGGDEFIVILPRVRGEADLSQMTARLLGSIREPIASGDQEPITITASIGISRFPVDGETSDALLNRSDAAMYQVKRGGGNAFDICLEDSAAGK
jgi:chemotaxis family two-component system sensor kinase Cph1